MKKDQKILFDIAKEFVEKYVAGSKQIVGAILVGSATLGVEDELVDIDILVYASEKSVKDRKAQGKGYNESYEFKGIEICVDWSPTRELEETVNNWKDDESLWVFHNAKVIYDPKNTIKRLLDRVKPYPTEIKRKKIFLHYYLLKASLENCRKSILRREMLTAAFLLYKAIDELSYLVFLLEDSFVPYPKWRFYFMRKLPLGKKLHPKIENIMRIKEANKEELTKKLEMLEEEVVEDLNPYFNKAGIPKEWLGEEWWRYEPDWHA